jgi:hypothetical protein
MATWTERMMEVAEQHAADYAAIEGHYLDRPQWFRVLRAERNRGERVLEKLYRRQERRRRGY